MGAVRPAGPSLLAAISRPFQQRSSGRVRQFNDASSSIWLVMTGCLWSSVTNALEPGLFPCEHTLAVSKWFSFSINI